MDAKVGNSSLQEEWATVRIRKQDKIWNLTTRINNFIK
jgi:hypothetical protein